MASDSDLVSRLREILRNSNLDTATPASIRRQLEADFEVDLKDKKAFITEQIDAFLEEEPKSNQEEEEEEEEDKEENNVKSEVEGNSAIEAEKEENEDEEEESEEEDERKNERHKKVKKRGGGGFTKVCGLSPQLEKFTGASEMARTEVVKKIWAYIRENNLQDPKDRRNIICDESLHDLFHVKIINMFKMNKALAKHIWPLGEQEGCASNVKKQKKDGGEEVASNKVEEEENEEEGKEAEDRNRKRSKRKKSGKENKVVKKRGGGFTKLCSLSPELQAFTKVPNLARTEVVKLLWAYIKEKNLQDPKDKRKILCDESLRAIFCVDSIGMFQMNKALSKHIWPLEEEEGAASKTSDKGKTKLEDEDSDGMMETDTGEKKGGSELHTPCPLSDSLVKVLGINENSLSRADVMNRLWEYIKQNDLQDPNDDRRVLCDEKLKSLFDVDSFEHISLSDLLANHFIKTEQ